MSDRNLLDEFRNRKPGGDAPAKVLPLPVQTQTGTAENDESEVVERRAYGIGRGRRQPFMLDVRLMDNQRSALPYSHLAQIVFDPSGVIILEFSSHLVRVEGRNLPPVYEHLVLQNVMYLQEENAELEPHVNAAETFISNIEISRIE